MGGTKSSLFQRLGTLSNATPPSPIYGFLIGISFWWQLGCVWVQEGKIGLVQKGGGQIPARTRGSGWLKPVPTHSPYGLLHLEFHSCVDWGRCVWDQIRKTPCRGRPYGGDKIQPEPEVGTLK